MTKVALYARYSSENQKDSSIDQQMRLLRDRAAIEGWDIVGVYEDKALSGSNMIRPGVQALLSAALDKQFDVVLTESIDRLSRDQEDIAHMHKRFRHRGIQIITLLEGEISELHIGLKGTMSALYLKDLARRTHRGLKERALHGESAGGKSYGYDIEPRYDAKGNRISGLRKINEEQAAIVRRICEEYCSGKSPRKIAHELNAEGVRGQNGNDWAASTIYGNRRRGTGILNNELYIGKQIWGKQSFFKDPDTGRENGRMNDESTWVRADVPHLRIIDDALWDRVKKLQKAMDEKESFRDKKRPKNLFSFLLTCGECGGGMSKISATHYGCSAARNKGTCTNRTTIGQVKLEGTVLSTLHGSLMQPALCAEFCKEYTAHLNRLAMGNNAALQAGRAELERVERSIAKLIEALKNGVDPILIRDEINGLQARKLQLQGSLETKSETPVYVHPNMAQNYHKQIQRLIVSLNEPEHRDESAQLVRKLIDKIVLTPNEDRRALTVDLYGDLAGILRMSSGRSMGERNQTRGNFNFVEVSEIQQVRVVTSCSDCLEPSDSDYESQVQMAGAAGFEPANDGIKSRCLTTWRRPISLARCGSIAAEIVLATLSI